MSDYSTADLLRIITIRIQKEQKENGEYSGVASGSNNYAPSNPELEKRIAEDVEKFMKEK